MKVLRVAALWMCMAVCSASAIERMALLPDGSVVRFRAVNTSGLVDALKTTTFANLWNDTAVRDFMGNPSIETAIKLQLEDETLDDSDRESARLMMDMIMMLQGELVVSIDVDGNPNVVAWMSEEDQQKFMVNQRRVVELSEGSGRITRSRFQGADVYRITTVSDEEAAEDGIEEETQDEWFAWIGETMIFGMEEEWLHRTISTLKREQIEEPGEKNTIELFVDIPSIITAVRKEFEEQPDAGAEFDRILSALGVTDMGVINVKAEISPKLVKVNADIPLGSERKGILSLFKVPRSTTSFKVPFVSGNTIGYNVSRMNLNALWDAVPGMLTQIVPDPSGQAMISGMLDQISIMLGVDLESDLLDHIGTQFVTIQISTEDNIATTYALELGNEAAFKASLSKVLSEGSPMYTNLSGSGALKEEELRGETYFVIDPLGNGEEAIALAAAGGYFIAGDAAGVKEALQGLSSRQADRFYSGKIFSELRKWVPPTAFEYSVQDTGAMIKLMIDLLSEELGMIGAISQPDDMPPFMQEMVGRIEMNKMPSGDHISSFFGPVLSYSELHGDTLSIRIELRNPEAD